MERYANKQNLVQLAKAVHDKYSPVATPTANGLMSAEDKAKVDNLGKTDDPTDAGPIVELTAKGWAEQDTTVGKNLLVGSTKRVIEIAVTTGAYYDINGKKASGTGVNATYQSVTIGQQYTFKATFTGVNGAQLVANNSGSAVLVATLTSGTPVTFTATYDTLMFRLSLNDNATATITEAQLELGSTATSYEPYSGGAPSPSPSYPQEIRRVTGRNLLDMSTATPRSSSKLRYDITLPIKRISVGDTIVASCDSEYRIAYYSKDAGGTVVEDSGWLGNNTPYTVKNDAGTDLSITTYAVIRNASDTRIELSALTAAKLQLELGSTAHPYVPYGHVGVDAQGRNLLDYDAWKSYSNITHGTAVWENNGVTLTATERDCYTYASSTGGYHISVTEGQVLTLSWNADSNTSGVVYIFPNGVLNGAVTADNSSAKSLTITIGAGVTFIAFRFGVRNAGDTIRYSDIQLELGTEATEYTPYVNYSIPIPLPSRGWVAALPDGTADTLTLDGAGGYVWTKACEEVTFDGSNDENWLLRVNNKNCYTTSLRPTIARPSANTAVANVLCDSLGRTNLSALETNVGIAMSIDGDIHISDKTDGDMTLADFTSWLAENPITVLYEAASPTTESGYVDMPTVPIHAAISSADLVDLTVRCCADEGAAEIASAWGRKYESRIAALEDAVAELVAGA